MGEAGRCRRDDAVERQVKATERRLGRQLRSGQIEKLSKAPAHRWSSARDVSSDLEFIERPPDGRQKCWELMGERRVVFRRVCEYHQLFADQVVERALRAEASLDGPGCPALLNPNLLEPHVGNIALQRRARNAPRGGGCSSRTCPAPHSRLFVARPLGRAAHAQERERRSAQRRLWKNTSVHPTTSGRQDMQSRSPQPAAISSTETYQTLLARAQRRTGSVPAEQFVRRARSAAMTRRGQTPSRHPSRLRRTGASSLTSLSTGRRCRSRRACNSVQGATATPAFTATAALLNL